MLTIIKSILIFLIVFTLLPIRVRAEEKVEKSEENVGQFVTEEVVQKEKEAENKAADDNQAQGNSISSERREKAAIRLDEKGKMLAAIVIFICVVLLYIKFLYIFFKIVRKQ
ncbi:MAG: hypothetical protein ACRC3H_08350 [Lachnospiraceae bacterium]